MSNSIIVFTMHKSASMFIHRQCDFLSKLSGIAYRSPNVAGIGRVKRYMRRYKRLDARTLLTDKDVWHAHNSCYAPIRFLVDVPNLEDYEVILHLRDPRDVLVSMFYSYCYIHGGEIEGNTGYRKEIADEGIDTFVLGKASHKSARYKGDYGTGRHVEDLIGNIPKRYSNYIERLFWKPNVTFVKYEEMVTNYRCWIEKFIKPFPLNNKEKVVEKLVADSSNYFPKRDTDAMTHIRHVTPGDYRNKLKPSTINQLNEIFGETLDVLGYKREV